MIHSKLTFSFVALVLQRDWKALIKPQNTVAETHLLPFNLREKWPGGEQHTAAFNVVILAQGFQSHCDFLGQGVRTWVLGMSRYSLSWWGCPGTVCHGGAVQVQSIVVGPSRYNLSWWVCPDTVCHGGTVQVQSVVVGLSRYSLSW